MYPQIQTEYLRSGGATALILMVVGARAVISLLIRSARPTASNSAMKMPSLVGRKDGSSLPQHYLLSLQVGGQNCRVSAPQRSAADLLSQCTLPGSIVVPPDSTMLPYRSFLMTGAHFIIELIGVS